ncbi:MAG: radical SAM protein [Myxococcota bacterium]|nr:radical SAM protein [Myxococcota bacterium]
MKPLDLPGAYLVLDLGNRCPLACRHCIQNEPDRHEHFRTLGQMDVDLATSLLDELADRGRRFHSLILFWLGEPLQHPQFVDIHRSAVAAAARGVFRRIEVHTNAVLLQREIARAVLSAGPVPQRWHFSLDAASPSTYTKVKGRDHYWGARQNVLAFLEERAGLDAQAVSAVFQFIPQVDNAGEAVAFARTWRRAVERHGGQLSLVGGHVPEDVGDVVFFRQLDALEPGEQEDANRLYRQVLRRTGVEPRPALTDRLRRRLTSGRAGPASEPVPCACPFLSPVVHWDGRLTVCTRDSGLELSPGSLRDGSFHDLWWESPGLGELRAAHLAGTAGGLCRDCPIPRSANYTGLTRSDLDRYRRG